jgi:hypothetical protein
MCITRAFYCSAYETVKLMLGINGAANTTCAKRHPVSTHITVAQRRQSKYISSPGQVIILGGMMSSQTIMAREKLARDQQQIGTASCCSRPFFFCERTHMHHIGWHT